MKWGIQSHHGDSIMPQAKLFACVEGASTGDNMNDVYVHLTLLERVEDASSVRAKLDVPLDRAADTALTNQDIRKLYLAAPTPQAAALANELYRVRALLCRTAQFLDVAKQRGIEQLLDITSRHLMQGLSQALESEPAILERRTARAGAPSLTVYRCQAYEAGTRRWHCAEHEIVPTHAARPRADESEADERERLFTWKLLPEPGRGAQVWRNMSYRGVVIVRAYDPVQARRLAAEKLSAACRAPEKSKRTVATNPWRKRSLVRVELVPGDDAYQKIAVPSVVYP